MNDQYNELCESIRRGKTAKTKPMRSASAPKFLKLTGRQITQADIDREVSALRDAKVKSELGI